MVSAVCGKICIFFIQDKILLLPVPMGTGADTGFPEGGGVVKRTFTSTPPPWTLPA